MAGACLLYGKDHIAPQQCSLLPYFSTRGLGLHWKQFESAKFKNYFLRYFLGALVHNESLTLLKFWLLTATFFELKSSQVYQINPKRWENMTVKTFFENLLQGGQNINSKSIVKFAYSPCTYNEKNIAFFAQIVRESWRNDLHNRTVSVINTLH